MYIVHRDVPLWTCSEETPKPTYAGYATLVLTPSLHMTDCHRQGRQKLSMSKDALLSQYLLETTEPSRNYAHLSQKK